VTSPDRSFEYVVATLKAIMAKQRTLEEPAGRRRPFPLPGALRDVERLLACASERQERPWQLWVPCLAAMMGLRAGESAMLASTDLERHHGRWFLRIVRGADGPLAKRRRRLLPIPRSLEEAGFVTFAQGASGHLFPELVKTPSQATIYIWVKHCGAGATTRGTGLSFRDLRKACVRALHNDGANPYALNTYMGRPGPRTTKPLRDAFDAWNEPHVLLQMVDQTTFPSLTYAATRVSERRF
jgi:hypothetical protein